MPLIRIGLGALLMAVALSAHSASGDNAVTGVKVTVGGQSQTALFATGSNQVALTFDISSEAGMTALQPGQSLSLPVTAVVDPALLPDACGCTTKELSQQVTYAEPPAPAPAPTPVPTLSEIGLGVLAALILPLALRTGAGRRGLKMLTTLGLGLALL